jgi:hypothetical protein
MLRLPLCAYFSSDAKELLQEVMAAYTSPHGPRTLPQQRLVPADPSQPTSRIRALLVRMYHPNEE